MEVITIFPFAFLKSMAIKNLQNFCSLVVCIIVTSKSLTSLVEAQRNILTRYSRWKTDYICMSICYVKDVDHHSHDICQFTFISFIKLFL